MGWKWILWSTSSLINLLLSNAVSGTLAWWTKTFCHWPRSHLTAGSGFSKEQRRLKIKAKRGLQLCLSSWNSQPVAICWSCCVWCQNAASISSLTCITTIITRHYYHHWCTQFDGQPTVRFKFQPLKLLMCFWSWEIIQDRSHVGRKKTCLGITILYCSCKCISCVNTGSNSFTLPACN